MGELLTYKARAIQAKGADNTVLPDETRLKQQFFQDDYENLSLLKNIPPFTLTTATLLYPGCGADIVFPLQYIERLFPALEQAECIFVDQCEIQDTIKTVLDDIGIPFSEYQDTIKFYWNGKDVRITFLVGDIFELITAIPTIDIYFERTFRIMRERHPEYEQKIVEKLNRGGILISDSGFQNTILRKITVPKELSAYGEMMMGVKE